MKRLILNLLVVSLVFLFACSHEERHQVSFAPKVKEAKGYLVPKDSVQEPKSILAGKPRIVKAGNPNIVATNTNIHPVGISKIILTETPRVSTPGQDTFKLPNKSLAIDSPFVAGIPEVVTAKDAYTRDQNPQNFSSFKKLQGLKHSNIRCLLEDKSGNIWFGTQGGGVTKYDGKSFTHFTEKEGLSNNVVVSILEDKSGNFWFGTFGGGVSKYDGKSFTNFTEKEGLSNKTVWSILEDKFGNIWFGTQGEGVYKYDGNSFTHFTKVEGLSGNDVRSILEDKFGNIWFGTYGGGASKYDGISFTHFTEKEGLGNNVVFSILEDKLGNLWFGSYGGGVSKYDGNRVEAIERGEKIPLRDLQGLKKINGKLVKSFTHFTEKEGLINNTVWSILEDKSGNIWLCTDGGVSKYNGKSFTHFTEKEGLSNNTVWSTLEDKSGNIWFGTQGGGVSKYDGNSFTHFTENEGLNNNVVLSILEDKSGNLWFGTQGGGVSKYDGKSFTHFTEKEGLSNNTVGSILEDRSGNLWFGSDVGVSKYDGESFTHFTEKEGLGHNAIFSIIEDKSGNIWFGSYGGGVSKYDGNSFTRFTVKEGLSHNDVRSLYEDRSGNIWIGTLGGGVSKYDGNRVEAIERGEKIPLQDQQDLKKINGKLVKSFTHFTEKEGLSHNSVMSILEDKSGNIWFGTYGGGVSKYDGKSFTHFTEKEGLSHNVVLSILEDKSGNIWFGTRFGLSKLTQSKSVEISNKIQSNSIKEQDIFFKNYTYEDGFLGIGCNRNSMYQAKDGTIWIGTNDRLTAYHPPSDGTVADTAAPNIQLTGLELFNENISWANLENKKDTTLTLGNGVGIGDFEFDGVTRWYSLPEHLSLAYNNNYLTFNYIGITMMQPKKVKYQYKLEGIDENWSALTNRTSAPYGNLPEGNYAFKVKAMNSEGYWSKEFVYSFVIRPPWWKTWWFQSLIGLIIISTIWYYIKFREKKLIAEKEKLERTVEERTAEVKEEKKVVEAQKHLIEEKHKEITDSINYAERIQRSFLATKNLLDENLKEYFVFFQPKDIVSGDFYWACKLGNTNFALVTADSTGHGVPGAIMSILNITCLEDSVKEGFMDPSGILNHTRTSIINRLKKDGSAEGGKDGMDASLVCFDFKTNKLIYAAANNPVWIVREKQIIELSPDKMPVGKHDKDYVPFAQHEINLQKGDIVYTLTDGMPDQFGGPLGKKYMYKSLKELLIRIAQLPMNEQKETIRTTLNNWKGDLEQVDDVCLIGVKI